jgi:hypothetical protein
MKKIQIKVDRQARAAAIYISGKLINLSIPEGWMYFYICGHRIDIDESFIAFLNAVACETEEELEQFKDLLEPCLIYRSYSNNWKEILEELRKKIEEADDSKIRPSERSVAVVYKHKLVQFVKNKDDGYYYADEIKISNSQKTFVIILKAVLCETEPELENITPTLDLVDPDWKVKAKKVKEFLTDDLFK